MFKCPNETCEKNKNGFQKLLKENNMSSTLECTNCEICLICCTSCNKLIENVLKDIIYCTYCGFQIPTATTTRVCLGLPSLYPMPDDTIRCIQRSIDEKKLIESTYNELQMYKNNNNMVINNRTFPRMRKLSELYKKYDILVNREIRQLDLLCIKSFEEPRILVTLNDLNNHNVSSLFQKEDSIYDNMKDFFQNIENILNIRKEIKKNELYKKAIIFIVDDENFVNHKHSKFFLNDVHKKQIDYYEKKMKDVVTPYYNILEYINELLKPKYKEVIYQFNQQQNVITNKNDIEMLRQLYITISTVIFMR